MPHTFTSEQQQKGAVANANLTRRTERRRQINITVPEKLFWRIRWLAAQQELTSAEFARRCMLVELEDAARRGDFRHYRGQERPTPKSGWKRVPTLR